MLAGAAVTISVVANLVPGLFRQLCDAAVSGDTVAAERIDQRLAPLVEALNGAPNPIAVKSGLPLLGLGLALPRLPLVELEDGAVRQQIHHALAQLAPLAVAA
jgi:4-hydroxy-tetrahydrodipicolinate synthase